MDDQSFDAAALTSNGTAFDRVALLLQGGGALGAYQAGAYEALAAAGVEPNWIAGISIGAINSALIAGNPPERRLAALRDFWEMVSAPADGGLADYWTGLLTGDFARGWLSQWWAGQALTQGSPGFFTPRNPPPYMACRGSSEAVSWYDVRPLRATLERLVDFDRINDGQTRFSVGAVDVATGNFTCFDNRHLKIGPEHIMASGALPPAFAPVEIDGAAYWDGGLVSNTPLEWVLSLHDGEDTLAIQVDLWSARGEPPKDLFDVAVRQKDIQFSSRTRAATDRFRKEQRMRRQFNTLYAKLPPELADSPEARRLAKLSDPASYAIVQLIYYAGRFEGQSKDHEFSRRTMEEHWRAGRRDAEKTLAHPEVLRPPRGDHAVKVYDFCTPGARQPVRTDNEEGPA